MTTEIELQTMFTSYREFLNIESSKDFVTFRVSTQHTGQPSRSWSEYDPQLSFNVSELDKVIEALTQIRENLKTST